MRRRGAEYFFNDTPQSLLFLFVYASFLLSVVVFLKLLLMFFYFYILICVCHRRTLSACPHYY